MALVDGGTGGGETVPPTGGGGGLPAWFQYGSGSPVGVVTPSQVPALYFDSAVSGSTGMWFAIGAADTDWIPFGGLYETSGAGGLTFSESGGVGLVAINSALFLESGPDSVGGEIKISPTDFNLASAVPWMQFNTSTGLFVLFINAGDPNGVVTAFEIGDACVDTSTPALWQATAADDSHWVQVGGGGGGSTTAATVALTTDNPTTIITDTPDADATYLIGVYFILTALDGVTITITWTDGGVAQSLTLLDNLSEPANEGISIPSFVIHASAGDAVTVTAQTPSASSVATVTAMMVKV